MESSFCLVKTLSTKFEEMLKSGEINPAKLASMTSAERREFFSKDFGERNAKEINALFESKLLLKNQQRGLITWAKQIGSMKPAAKKEIIDKIMRMDTILSPENEREFLTDLASKRLGTDITTEEATTIVALSNKIRQSENFTDEVGRIAFGRDKLNLMSYVNSLNPKKASIWQNIAGIPRAVMSSLDLSAPLNQGWGMVSRKEFYSAFKEMFKFARSEENLLNLQADILTRPNYKAAKRAGLRLTDLGNTLEKREEAFMTTLLDKVPGISASQRAYTGFLTKLRMDVFDNLIKKAELAGEDVGYGSQALEDIAKVVNNFTGGARVGRVEGAVPFLNAVFFSPRKIASSLNILNPKNYIDPKISPTARKAALRNLIGSLAGTATLLGLGKAVYGDDAIIETDPRSSDYGKLKIGNTRVDFSGGNATYATLASRILSRSIKSTTTGEVKKLGEDFGNPTASSLVANTIRYKLAPNTSMVWDILEGKNAIGEKVTIPESVMARFKPMFLSTLAEIVQEDTDGSAALIIPALFGAGANTYKEKESTSSRSDSRSGSRSSSRTTSR